MEFNVIDENNKFKVGNIISVFRLPNYNKEFALFSISDYEDDEASLHIAYLLKDAEGYDYVDEIQEPQVLRDAVEAVKQMLDAII